MMSSYETHSDESLMLQFQAGSRVAFDELYSRYNGPLYGFFRRRVESPQRAEDLAQETFLAVIRGATRYEPRALLRTYLYGIALKLLMADRRQQRREPSPALETTPEPSANHTPETALWLRQAIGRLDSIDREVLMLREYEQLSYSEIAELLRIPINTVRSRLFRARTALRDHLHPEPQSQTSTGTSETTTGDQE